VLDTLAAAYAEAGRFPDAVATARAALKLAAKLDRPEWAKSVRARIALYEAGRAYRGPLPQSSERGSDGPLTAPT
jgi:hypothetical protein